MWAKAHTESQKNHCQVSHPLLHIVDSLDNDNQNDDLTLLFIIEEGKNKVFKIFLWYISLVRQISIT